MDHNYQEEDLQINCTYNYENYYELFLNFDFIRIIWFLTV